MIWTWIVTKFATWWGKVALVMAAIGVAYTAYRVKIRQAKEAGKAEQRQENQDETNRNIATANRAGGDARRNPDEFLQPRPPRAPGG